MKRVSLSVAIAAGLMASLNASVEVFRHAMVRTQPARDRRPHVSSTDGKRNRGMTVAAQKRAGKKRRNVQRHRQHMQRRAA